MTDVIDHLILKEEKLESEPAFTAVSLVIDMLTIGTGSGSISAPLDLKAIEVFTEAIRGVASGISCLKKLVALISENKLQQPQLQNQNQIHAGTIVAQLEVLTTVLSLQKFGGGSTLFQDDTLFENQVDNILNGLFSSKCLTKTDSDELEVKKPVRVLKPVLGLVVSIMQKLISGDLKFSKIGVINTRLRKCLGIFAVHVKSFSTGRYDSHTEDFNLITKDVARVQAERAAEAAAAAAQAELKTVQEA